MRTDLFDRIAPYYGWFYSMQKKNYSRILQKNLHHLKLPAYASVLDIGCGTGAFCSALHDCGFSVTGVDPARRMLAIARKRNENRDIHFLEGSFLQGLPFADAQFDWVLTSYVAHGFKKNERKILYEEMLRVSRKIMLVHDFYGASSPLIRLVEHLEGSDYEHFCLEAEAEMTSAFDGIRIIPVSQRAAWYIGEKEYAPRDS